MKEGNKIVGPSLRLFNAQEMKISELSLFSPENLKLDGESKVRDLLKPGASFEF